MAEVVVVRDQDAAGELAAGSILDVIAAKPEAVLGLATGSTPLVVYRALER
ncbi:glucosamine-6-phosphate deaminase, partial [Leifsonia sp. ku-ls]